MDHTTRPSKRRAARPLTLRIGIIQSGHIIEERKLDRPTRVTVGQSPRNLFTLSAAGLPRSFELFRADGPRHVLRFAPGMEGRVTVGGRLKTLGQARDAGDARASGDWLELPLEAGARGKVRLGEVTVLFQQLPGVPETPQPRLPASLQGGVVSRMDPAFSLVLSGTVALAAAFVIAVQLVPKPSRTMSGSRIRTLLKDEARLRHREPAPPKPAATVRAPRRGEPGNDPRVTSDVAEPTRRSTRKGATRSDRPAAKLKKGTAEYRAALAALTDFDPADGRMAAIAIGARCRTEAECRAAVHGRDSLRGGASFSDLDDPARRAGGIASHRPTGPSSVPRTGLVRSGGRPVVSGVKTRRVTAPAGEPMRRPRRLKTPRGGHTFKPPTVRARGGASISARVRSRVYGLRYCYNRLLPSQPTLQGAVRISFVVLPNGRVRSVSVRTGMGASMKSCVRAKVAGWTLGKPKITGPVHYGPFTVRFHPR